MPIMSTDFVPACGFVCAPPAPTSNVKKLDDSFFWASHRTRCTRSSVPALAHIQKQESTVSVHTACRYSCTTSCSHEKRMTTCVCTYARIPTHLPTKARAIFLPRVGVVEQQLTQHCCSFFCLPHHKKRGADRIYTGGDGVHSTLHTVTRQSAPPRKKMQQNFFAFSQRRP